MRPSPAVGEQRGSLLGVFGRPPEQVSQQSSHFHPHVPLRTSLPPAPPNERRVLLAGRGQGQRALGRLGARERGRHGIGGTEDTWWHCRGWSGRAPAGGSGLQGGPWHPAQLFDQEKPGRASLIHGQRGKPAPSGARSLPRGGGAAPLPELAPASQVGGQGSGRSAPCLARPRLPRAVFLPLLAFWLIPRRKGEGQTRRPGTGWHAGTTRSTRRRPEARVLRRWAPLSRPHAASACPPRMLPSCSVAGISSSSPSPICTARLIVPKADRPHTSQSQARRGTAFRIKQEANALCGRAPASHTSSCGRPVRRNQPSSPPCPRPPGAPRIVPSSWGGCQGASSCGGWSYGLGRPRGHGS